MPATNSFEPSLSVPSSTPPMSYSVVSRWSRTRKFLAYYRPYLSLLIADMACACVVAATILIVPLCVRHITKDILSQQGPSALNQLVLMAALMVVLVIVYGLCNLFVDIQGHMMGARMENDMRRELFDHYLQLSFGYYDEQRIGQLMIRLTNDTLALAELYHHGPEDILISTVTIVGTFVILLGINTPLTIIVFLFIPLMATYALYFYQRMQHAARRSKDRVGDINAQVEDTLAGIRVVKSFTNEAVERQKFAREIDRFLNSRRDEYASGAFFGGGLFALTQLMTIAVLLFGGIAITRRVLDLSDLLTYLLYIGILIDPIQKIVNFARLYQEGSTGFARFMDAFEAPLDIKDAPDAHNLTHVQGEVQFQHVYFRYQAHRDEVIHNLSLTIHAGEYVALVGASGVGKTTLCALIPRFYDVTSGTILLDGEDIRAITLSSLRRHIGVVQQDVYLFAGTVADNIRYGDSKATMNDIIAAAKQAQAHEFIMELPDGYETDIGQRGVKLSGGQKQRLSIARVFLKNPPIIIFDEATSALDNESERGVQTSLERLIDNRTMLVIAHRLSTIRNAQRIVVLTNTGIAEQGTHAELLALNGVYSHLYTMQAKI